MKESQNSKIAIYKGTIRHRRFSPITHEFKYRLTMVMLDLDHINDDLNVPLILSGNTPALGWFRRKDYLGSPNTSLKKYIQDAVFSETNEKITGKILLLTHLRYWGFIMNPISIFYCYDDKNELMATALQVTNTPWKDKVLYINPTKRDTKNHLTKFKKKMHVSPFNPMEMQYLCRFQVPDSTLFFHLENHDNVTKITDATMAFRKVEATKRSLIKLVFIQPSMTIKTGFGIYWQALKLWMKKSPLYDHPNTEKINLGRPAQESNK